jgi:hypothetical protein
MSESWIILVPKNPDFIPNEEDKALAEVCFTKLIPNQEISSEVYKAVQFIHCGENFESITCPICQSEVSSDWWIEQMDEDYDQGFLLAMCRMPCCGSSLNLNISDLRRLLGIRWQPKILGSLN